MSKLIAAFLLGVISTLAVVFLLQPSEKSKNVNGQTSIPEESTDVRRTSPAPRVDQKAEENDDDSHLPTPAEPGSTGVPMASKSQESAALQQDRRATGTARELSARDAHSEYPPEIAEMIEKRVDEELQSRYENDEREESWATYMEGQLAGYFAQKPSLVQFHVSLIDCRTSICSVHVLGYGQNALTQWNTATADIVSQPWFEFDNMSMNRRNPEPGILAIVLILTRKPPVQ